MKTALVRSALFAAVFALSACTSKPVEKPAMEGTLETADMGRLGLGGIFFLTCLALCQFGIHVIFPAFSDCTCYVIVHIV